LAIAAAVQCLPDCRGIHNAKVAGDYEWQKAPIFRVVRN
jgi:hypothetical protein